MLVDSDAISLLAPSGYAELPDDMKNATSQTLYSHTCDERQILYTDYSGLISDPNGQNAFLSLAIIFLVVALALGASWQYINQSRCSTMVIVYQFMLMAGIVLTYLSVIFFYKKPSSNTTCQLRIWLPTVGYTLVLVAAFERTFQMHTVYEKVPKISSVI
jgi:hypothetical protein